MMITGDAGGGRVTVFGEIGLFTVLRYRLFALSFRYTDAKQNTVGHKGQ